MLRKESGAGENSGLTGGFLLETASRYMRMGEDRQREQGKEERGEEKRGEERRGRGRNENLTSWFPPLQANFMIYEHKILSLFYK